MIYAKNRDPNATRVLIIAIIRVLEVLSISRRFVSGASCTVKFNDQPVDVSLAVAQLIPRIFVVVWKDAGIKDGEIGCCR